jgi:DNA-binding beta-propeller fold protein YncE
VTQTAYTQALEERGYRGEEIGTYAGLADTSLMLAIDPTLVRVDALRNGAKPIGFIPTGVGAHGLYPSPNGRKLYVANWGSDKVNGPPRGQGSVSVIDFATRQVESTWPVPGGGSPDMGNVSADGK